MEASILPRADGMNDFRRLQGKDCESVLNTLIRRLVGNVTTWPSL